MFAFLRSLSLLFVHALWWVFLEREGTKGGSEASTKGRSTPGGWMKDLVRSTGILGTRLSDTNQRAPMWVLSSPITGLATELESVRQAFGWAIRA